MYSTQSQMKLHVCLADVNFAEQSFDEEAAHPE